MIGRLLIRGDAVFLLVMGAFGLIADLASYAAGAGPFGAAFHRDPQVIGVVEAHGLAMLIGLGAWVGNRIEPSRQLHWQLALTHALLGTANIAFFDVFLAVGEGGAGVAVTAVHLVLAILQAGAGGWTYREASPRLPHR